MTKYEEWFSIHSGAKKQSFLSVMKGKLNSISSEKPTEKPKEKPKEKKEKVKRIMKDGSTVTVTTIISQI